MKIVKDFGVNSKCFIRKRITCTKVHKKNVAQKKEVLKQCANQAPEANEHPDDPCYSKSDPDPTTNASSLRALGQGIQT